MRHHARPLAQLAVLLSAGGLVAQAPLPELPAPADPAVQPALAVDEAVNLESMRVEPIKEDKLVRIILKLSGPKTQLDSRFDGQGSFLVRLRRTAPAAELPARVEVAKKAVADVLVRAEGEDAVIRVRLNTPTRCRAYALPAEHEVRVDISDPPPPELPDSGRPRPAFGTQIVSAEFVDTDIRVIIDALVAQSGGNVLLQPGITGSYSLSLHDVTLAQALDAIWEAWGLVWMELPGDIYLIGGEQELGDRRVDTSLPLPQGWTAAETWAVTAARFPELRLQRELATVPADGPLPVAGQLRVVGAARRWLATQVAAPGQPVPLPLIEPLETVVCHPRHLAPAAAREALLRDFPKLTVELDTAAGKLTLAGPREEVLRAKSRLDQLDVEAAREVEEAAYLPLVPPERLTELARRSGVAIDVLYSDADGSVVYFRGPEAKVRSLRALVQQLQDVVRRQADEERQPR